MPNAQARRNRRFVYYIALGALLVSLFGNLLVFFLAKNTTDKIIQQRKVGRVLIAKSDLDLCTNIYRNIYGATKDAEKKATFSYYHRLLPSLTTAEIANLVIENRAALARQAAKFNPKQCLNLPSQKLTTSKPKNL